MFVEFTHRCSFSAIFELLHVSASPFRRQDLPQLPQPPQLPWRSRLLAPLLFFRLTAGVEVRIAGTRLELADFESVLCELHLPCCLYEDYGVLVGRAVVVALGETSLVYSHPVNTACKLGLVCFALSCLTFLVMSRFFGLRKVRCDYKPKRDGMKTVRPASNAV